MFSYERAGSDEEESVEPVEIVEQQDGERSKRPLQR